MSSSSNSTPDRVSPSILVPESPEVGTSYPPGMDARLSTMQDEYLLRELNEPNNDPATMRLRPFMQFENLEMFNIAMDNTILHIRRLAEREEARRLANLANSELNEAAASSEAVANNDPNVAEVANDPSVSNNLNVPNAPDVPAAPSPPIDTVHSEDSNTASSISEDSNSLPEAHMRDSSNHEEAPPAKLRKVTSPQRHEDLDGESCPICLEPWGNSGEHRLVALKCGHLFGSQCVERWIKAQPVKDRSCPTCKTKAAMKDLRFIYARKLIAADTSQITGLQKQLETLQAEKSRTELELQKTKIAHRACLAQLEELKTSMVVSQTNKAQLSRRSWRFALEKNLEICKDGGCRVLTYNCRTYELYVSQKSTNCIFPGYGIRKVSCVDYQMGQFVHLHPKPIRDIAYSQPRDLLLSVGLDSTAKIVDRGIPSVTVQAGFPLWSCAWDTIRTNEFYVGGVGGMIHQYDYRNPSTCIQTLTGVGHSVDMSPVVSICSTEYGLMSCQLNSCWLWEANNGRWEPRLLPVEGSFMSLNYDSDSHRAVIAVRPSVNGMERSKLAVCKLKASGPMGEVYTDVEETFNSSTTCSLMSRATFAKAPGASWVAAHSESDSTLYLHGLDGLRTMSLPAAEPAIDICSVQLNGNSVLAALSESRLRIYKAVPTSA